MKTALICGALALAIPASVSAQDANPAPDRPEFAEERPFADARPDVRPELGPDANPRRIAKARKKAARIKAARLKHKRIKAARLKHKRIKAARLKHKRIKMHRIKMARRKAAAGR